MASNQTTSSYAVASSNTPHPWTIREVMVVTQCWLNVYEDVTTMVNPDCFTGGNEIPKILKTRLVFFSSIYFSSLQSTLPSLILSLLDLPSFSTTRLSVNLEGESCSTFQTGDLTKPDRAIDGIFGFSQQGLSVIAQLSSQGITPGLQSINLQWPLSRIIPSFKDMASHPCDRVTLEPNRVVETLKNLTTMFCDYRVLDVVNLLPTANDGTITHLYMQLLNLLDVIVDNAESKQAPAPEE
ncbi:unnamed protein product [Lactuca saligna]|uniref:Uncharacterized protein n=1 Tax=Lactuca saligna TaxID=75948 RepID=A0AA35YTR5_LACSI|nr:unnamed protein product [Lactuca saligna]